jgi:DNA-binding CsgD family transcriptional regulator
LTLREGDVFASVSRGMSNKEIAGEKTVKRYMTRITRKLQV